MDQILFFCFRFSISKCCLFRICKNPIYAILSLIVTFFTIAALYILLNAQFLGIIQIIVYAGAIMVLFLYVLMMLNLNKEDESKKHNINKLVGILAGGILFVGMLGAYKGLKTGVATKDVDVSVGLTKNLGKLLFNEYVLPFELASILILAGIVGAVLIGKKDL
jgi:NADH-quinone oxidoreductase subunit J